MKMRVFAAVLILVCLLTACAPAQAILGSWKYQTTVLGVVTETTYVFNEDGTGSMSGVLSVDFTYTIDDETLTITTTTLGIETSEEYFFKFEGSKLTLSNADETITLEKVN